MFRLFMSCKVRLVYVGFVTNFTRESGVEDDDDQVKKDLPF